MPATLTSHEDLLGLAPNFVVLDVQAPAVRWATPCIAPASRVMVTIPCDRAISIRRAWCVER